MLHRSQAMEIHAKCKKPIRHLASDAFFYKYFVLHSSLIGSTKRNDNAEHHDKAVIQGAKIKKGVKKQTLGHQGISMSLADMRPRSVLIWFCALRFCVRTVLALVMCKRAWVTLW
jgi:hypothetical protein